MQADPQTISFARRFRAARAALGESREALAKRAGVYHGTIGRLERGETIPSPKTLEKLLKALGLAAAAPEGPPS